MVILNTEANSSVESVYNGIPLMIGPEEPKDRGYDRATEYLSQRTPVLLKTDAEYEQISLC